MGSSMNTDDNENIWDALSSTKYWFSKLPLKISRSFVWFNESSVLLPTERPNETVCYSDITLFVIVISPCKTDWNPGGNYMFKVNNKNSRTRC